MSDYSDSQAIKIIKNIDSSFTTKRDGDKLKILDIDGKVVGTIKGGVTEKKIRPATGRQYGGAVRSTVVRGY